MSTDVESTAAQATYFDNHQNKLRFPWNLYHGPLVKRLARALADAPAMRVLNAGSGPFLELPNLPTHHEYVACDIDPYAVAAVRKLYPNMQAECVGDDGVLPFDGASFDAIISCDVIEHLDAPLPWLATLSRVLRPGGVIHLTTPNYGFSTLPILEATVLEVLARKQGFTRDHIHPSKMTKGTLLALFDEAGLKAGHVEVISFGWVLFASCHKPTA